ncbi:aspartate 1-decarboxylase [Acidiferrobacter sp.]|uniref:aspartate 1-decarboxylase n=1 Tax=Acidiferrobacter sp. TaxID=1872107 RepID=UPI0026129B69|nr:aspartate 1-decarboxylase [Acidiferrobacter sp.]
MQRTLLHAKLHRVRVTQVEIDYEGSVAIDATLLDAAGIREYERIDVFNVRNGERFSTYAIRGEPGSGLISVNGAAAHKAAVDDLIIICAFGVYEEREAREMKPRLIYVDASNRIVRSSHTIPMQAAR